MVRYDEDGNCTRCGLPGSGFVSDGVCHCLDDDKAPLTREEEDALEEWAHKRRQRDRL